MSGREMPKYKCHKEVWAHKINNIVRSDENTPKGPRIEYFIIVDEPGYGEISVTAEFISKFQPQIGGYYVVYKDGYLSYSPADAFEEGYTKI